ncbi:MAG: tetratricopeptide repeat protein, partial [Moorea sp. SIO2B7]|nr:tetratricopeptide repeat protein [Moorena sp. SIO2B7]
MNALQGMVSLLLQQNRPEAAIGLLQDTLKTAAQPDSEQSTSIDITSIKLLLAQIYASQKRYTEAIAVYDQTIKTNKEDFRPILAKALVLQDQGKQAEAKPLFTTALSLAPARYKDQIKQMVTQISEAQDQAKSKYQPETKD